MSKTIIKPSVEDREKINVKLKKINPTYHLKFYNFQEIGIDGLFTLEELKEITKVIETAEAWLALESKPLGFATSETEIIISQQNYIECGKAIEPIIKQCEKCGGAIRACCPDHEDNC